MNPIRAWNRFWFAPTSARPLGAMRILFGLACLLHLALLAPQAEYWLSDAGLLQGSEARDLATPLRPSPLQWAQDPVSVRLALAVTGVAALLFTLGWRTRVMGVLLYLGILSIHHRNLLSASGADTLLVVMAFLLMLSPCGAAYSLDARREARRGGWGPAEPLILPWSLRLIQIQIALIYFMTAWLKASGKTWMEGAALHYVLNNAESRRFTLGLNGYPALLNLLTYGALLTEFALAFLLWVRAARPAIVIAGLGLHGAIFLTVNIPIFGELMATGYLAFFSAGELDGWLRVLNPLRWLGLSAASNQSTVVDRTPQVPDTRRFHSPQPRTRRAPAVATSERPHARRQPVGS